MTAKLIELPSAKPQDGLQNKSQDELPRPTDEELLGACAAGDRDALGVLYDRHAKVLLGFLNRVLSPGAPEVDDIVQTTFIEAWRGAPRFNGKSAVRTWILAIGHNLARRHLRDRGRRQAAMDRWATIADRAVCPEGRWQDQLVLERMQAALQTLPPDLRVAFVLCDIEGLKGVEAAEVIGVRPGTLWRRLHDARKRLREALEGGPR